MSSLKLITSLWIAVTVISGSTFAAGKPGERGLEINRSGKGGPQGPNRSETARKIETLRAAGKIPPSIETTKLAAALQAFGDTPAREAIVVAALSDIGKISDLELRRHAFDTLGRLAENYKGADEGDKALIEKIYDIVGSQSSQKNAPVDLNNSTVILALSDLNIALANAHSRGLLSGKSGPELSNLIHEALLEGAKTFLGRREGQQIDVEKLYDDGINDGTIRAIKDGRILTRSEKFLEILKWCLLQVGK